MRIAVVGAGIIGVTTAYELARDGHEVSVFECQGNVASECSFANAGLVAPGYVTPWASPGMPRKVLRHLFSRHAPVRLQGANGATLAWLWRWWRACSLRTYQANRLRMQRLAFFSRARLQAISRELQLDYERSEGYLVLLRSAEDLALAQPGLALLNPHTTRFELLDAAQCRAIEPALSADTPLHAGIHLPDDEVGNCRQFALLLRLEAQRLGASFRFHTQVLSVQAGATPGLVHLPAGQTPPAAPVRRRATRHDAADTVLMAAEPVTEHFDAIVVCAALGAVALLRPLGLKLPLQPVYGYSVTAPLRESEHEVGPRSALMDERYKVAISRLGNRVRVAGSAEIGGTLERLEKRTLDTLYKVLQDWFPGAAQLSHAQPWKGARPMLPDGPPVIGPSGAEGVWLNLGHGSSGWALSCGSARLLADRIVGRTPAVDTEGLGIERLRG